MNNPNVLSLRTLIHPVLCLLLSVWMEQLLPGTIGLINKYLPGQRSKVEGLWHNGGDKRSPYHHWITLRVFKSPPESSPALPGTGTTTLVKREGKKFKKKIKSLFVPLSP